MAQFDTKSLAVMPNYMKENVLSLTIEMWNDELKSKVFSRLRSLPILANMGIGKDIVHVMPFEEVFLALNGSSHQLIRIDSQKQSYIEKKKTIKFGLIFDTAEAANSFLEDFRKDSGMMLLNRLHLVLKGRGLDLGNQHWTGLLYNYNIGNFFFSIIVQ